MLRLSTSSRTIPITRWKRSPPYLNRHLRSFSFCIPCTKTTSRQHRRCRRNTTTRGLLLLYEQVVLWNRAFHSSTSRRSFLAASSSAEIVTDDNEDTTSDSDNRKEEEEASGDGGSNDGEAEQSLSSPSLSNLDVFAREIPELVDEILSFHEELNDRGDDDDGDDDDDDEGTRNSRRRKRRTIRQRWKESLEFEWTFHSFSPSTPSSAANNNSSSEPDPWEAIGTTVGDAKKTIEPDPWNDINVDGRIDDNTTTLTLSPTSESNPWDALGDDDASGTSSTEAAVSWDEINVGTIGTKVDAPIPPNTDFETNPWDALGVTEKPSNSESAVSPWDDISVSTITGKKVDTPTPVETTTGESNPWDALGVDDARTSSRESVVSWDDIIVKGDVGKKDTSDAIDSMASRPLYDSAADKDAFVSTDASTASKDFRDGTQRIDETSNESSVTDEIKAALQSDVGDVATENFKTLTSEPNKQLLEPVTQALVLLRTLTENEWALFDQPLFHQPASESDEEEKKDDTTSEISDVEVDFDFDENDQSARDIHDEELAERGRATMARFEDLLRNAKLGHESLTTDGYNCILARLALSTELLPDELLDLIMQTYRQMEETSDAGFEGCGPNSVTYEILLLALYRRLSANNTATDIVYGLLESDSFTWTPKMLETAMHLCKQQSENELALEILKKMKSNKEMRIPTSVYSSLISLMKSIDARFDAIKVLELCLERAYRSRDPGIDRVFINTIKWPMRNRYGKMTDNSPVLGKVLRLLESSRLYTPGFYVWKEFVIAAARNADEDGSRWALVSRALKCLSASVPQSHSQYSDWPDYILLKHGLEASSKLRDSGLAADLISRALANSHVSDVPMQQFTSSRGCSQYGPLPNHSKVPFRDVMKAVEICVETNDMAACERIMNVFRTLKIPDEHLQLCYLLNLKGYANQGNAESTERLVSEMKHKGLVVGDEAYGAVIYSYAVAKQFEKARFTLQSMESGDLGVQPGPYCYDGFLLACILKNSWEDAVAAYKTMKESGIIPSPIANHGTLISSNRLGGRPKARAFLEELLASGSELNHDGSVLAVKIMLPEVDQGVSTISDLRNELRKIKENGGTPIGEASLNLVRSLRVAELEEERQAVRGLKMCEIKKRRKEAWRLVLQHLLDSVKAIEDTNS